jgi:hypothetical protein
VGARCLRCAVVGVGARRWTEGSGSREVHQGSSGPAHAEKSTRGSHHTDRDPAGSFDGEDTRRLGSRVVVVRPSMAQMGQLVRP